MKNLQLENILITFINDNNDIISRLEKELKNEQLIEQEVEVIKIEIGERHDMLQNAKFFLKEEASSNKIIKSSI